MSITNWNEANGIYCFTYEDGSVFWFSGNYLHKEEKSRDIQDKLLNYFALNKYVKPVAKYRQCLNVIKNDVARQDHVNYENHLKKREQERLKKKETIIGKLVQNLNRLNLQIKELDNEITKKENALDFAIYHSNIEAINARNKVVANPYDTNKESESVAVMKEQLRILLIKQSNLECELHQQRLESNKYMYK